MNTKIKLSLKLSALVLTLVVGLLLSASRAEARTVTTCTSATFQGEVSADRYNPTTVWFEWGAEGETKNSYGRMTRQQTFTSDGNFSELVTGLRPDTSYYYRAVASNESGESAGDLIFFQTPACGSSSSSNNQTFVPVYVASNPPVTNTIIRETIIRDVDSNTNSNINRSANSSANTNSYQGGNSSSDLSASAASAGYFFPTTLLGWVLFLIALLLIVIFFKRFVLPRSVRRMR